MEYPPDESLSLSHSLVGRAPRKFLCAGWRSLIRKLSVSSFSILLESQFQLFYWVYSFQKLFLVTIDLPRRDSSFWRAPPAISPPALSSCFNFGTPRESSFR